MFSICLLFRFHYQPVSRVTATNLRHVSLKIAERYSGKMHNIRKPDRRSRGGLKQSHNKKIALVLKIHCRTFYCLLFFCFLNLCNKFGDKVFTIHTIFMRNQLYNVLYFFSSGRICPFKHLSIWTNINSDDTFMMTHHTVWSEEMRIDTRAVCDNMLTVMEWCRLKADTLTENESWYSRWRLIPPRSLTLAQ